jgi:hypothetical protein
MFIILMSAELAMTLTDIAPPLCHTGLPLANLATSRSHLFHRADNPGYQYFDIHLSHCDRGPI